MQSFLKNFLLVAVAVLITLVIQNLIFPQGKTAVNRTETAYQRVMRTGVLRCAYGLWQPAMMRDPNTGQLSGIFYDLMQEVGKSLGLKVEYVLEVPFDSIGVALSSGKVDAHCAGVWATPARSRAMTFGHPLFWSPLVAFARKDDHRFDYSLDRINRPDITVALCDDDITTETYNRGFSQAKKYELPQFCPPEELFLAVATKKADVAFNAPTRLQSFAKSYPGKVKIIPARPLAVLPDTIAVATNEQELLNMLNTAIDRVTDTNLLEKLVQKYRGKYNMDFVIPVNRPYASK